MKTTTKTPVFDAGHFSGIGSHSTPTSSGWSTHQIRLVAVIPDDESIEERLENDLVDVGVEAGGRVQKHRRRRRDAVWDGRLVVVDDQRFRFDKRQLVRFDDAVFAVESEDDARTGRVGGQ